MTKLFRHPRDPWIARATRGLLALAVVTSGLLGPLTSVRAAHAEPREDREALVKAAFLFHFVEFVDWPDTVRIQPGSTIRVGILGEDPFGETIDQVFAEPSSDGHRFEIVRASDPSELADCRVVYVALDDAATVRDVIDAFESGSVLTIAHREGFATEGGHVNFFVEDDRLRFEVNLEAVQDAGLRLSSRLLKLARIVDPAPGR